MASTALRTPPRVASSNGKAQLAAADWRDPRYQAFALMRLAFTVAPIAFGVDKYFNVMVHWPKYLAPWLYHLIHRTFPPLSETFHSFVRHGRRRWRHFVISHCAQSTSR